jgi:HPt (histidine-containing phosphotransfer) domain-containing protein
VTSETAILDLRRLASLRLSGESGADAAFAALVELFLDTADATLGELRRAAEAEDPPGVAALAHRLKGSSALFGAERLGAACGAIEEAVRNGADAGALRSPLEVLSREVEAARAAMRRELDRG